MNDKTYNSQGAVRSPARGNYLTLLACVPFLVLLIQQLQKSKHGVEQGSSVDAIGVREEQS